VGKQQAAVEALFLRNQLGNKAAKNFREIVFYFLFRCGVRSVIRL
jgi:hypothetical protein